MVQDKHSSYTRVRCLDAVHDVHLHLSVRPTQPAIHNTLLRQLSVRHALNRPSRPNGINPGLPRVPHLNQTPASQAATENGGRGSHRHRSRNAPRRTNTFVSSAIAYTLYSCLLCLHTKAYTRNPTLRPYRTIRTEAKMSEREEGVLTRSFRRRIGISALRARAHEIPLEFQVARWRN